MKVLLILGNRMNDDGTISDIMEHRLIGALEIIDLFNIDKIICSGGVANKQAGVSESSKMKEYLINHHIDEEKIIEENESLSTVMNITCSAPIIKMLNPDVVYLLTSNDHLGRAVLNPILLFKEYLPEYKLISYGI